MSLTQFTENVNNHQTQPDQPAMTSAELKQLFDKAAEDIKDYINNILLPELDTALNSCVTNDKIVNNYNGGLNKVASAEIAKNLKQLIDNISTMLTNLSTLVNTKQNAILTGTTIPSSLDPGQIYIQLFD